MNAKNTTPNAPLLGPWQRKQAAMLYFYSSIAYLAPLHKMVSDIIDNVADPAIDLATRQGRDKHLVNKRWGERDTSNNWSNNAWSFLRDLQDSLAKDVSTRASGEYRTTSVNYYLRGLAEYSTEIDLMTSKMNAIQKTRFFESYTQVREQINHPNISGPFSTAWSYTDLDCAGMASKVGLPALQGQVTNLAR